MYSWLADVLNLPSNTSDPIVLGSVVLVIIAFAFFCKVIYKAVF